MKIKKLLVIFVLVLSLIAVSQTYINIGTIERNNEKFFVYELSPEFSIGPVTIGIGFTSYSTDVVYGEMYYGIPSSTPSTNILNAFVINTFALNTDLFEFRYGKVKPVTLAMGFNIRKYVNPNTRAFDITLKFSDLSLYTHLPYEISKYIPFEFLRSDSIFMTSLGYNLSSLLKIESYLIADVDATVSYTEDSSTPVKYGGGIAAYIPILNSIKIGGEIAAQSDESFQKISKGLFAGVFADLGLINPMGGIYYTMDGYIPFLFNKKYSSLKFDSNLPSMSSTDSVLGYFAGADIDFEPYITGEFYVYGLLENSTPVAEGNVRVILPELGNFSGLIIDGTYFDDSPFEDGKLLDENTEAILRLSYPLIGNNFVAGIQYKWESDEWFKSIFISSVSSF